MKFAAVVLGIFLVMPIAVTMVATAVSAIVTGVYAGYLGLLRKQYEAINKMMIHAFVPEPEPEPGYFESLAKQASLLIGRVDQNLLGILLVAIAILITMWTSAALAYYYLRKVTMRLRGIQFEAMRPGSVFTPGTIPSYQVRVMISGLLLDKHQGYGIRVGNWLVVPTHVIRGLRDIT